MVQELVLTIDISTNGVDRAPELKERKTIFTDDSKATKEIENFTSNMIPNWFNYKNYHIKIKIEDRANVK